MDITHGNLNDPSAFVRIASAGTQGSHKAWLDTASRSRQTSFETEGVASEWKGASVEVLA
jgi:hypothetical protein